VTSNQALPCHSERSEESTWTFAALNGFEPPAGFFAALLMNFPRRVILNEVKNPEPCPPAIIVLDSSLPLRMNSRSVILNEVKNPQTTPAKQDGAATGCFAALSMTRWLEFIGRFLPKVPALV